MEKLSQSALDRMQLIGKGMTAEIYAIDNKRALKLFFTLQDPDLIEREYALSKEASDYGIPAYRIYERVCCGDRQGFIMERFSQGTLEEAIASEPEKEDMYIDKYVSFLKKAHTTDMTDSKIIRHGSETFATIVKRLEGKELSSEETGIIRAFIKELDGETFVHGDAHPGNVMLRGDELVFIDMTTAARQKPLYDIMTVYYMLWADSFRLTEEEYREVHSFDRKTGRRIWKKILRGYYPDLAEEERVRIELLCERISKIRAFLFVLYKKAGVSEKRLKAMKAQAVKGASLGLLIRNEELYKEGFVRSYSGRLFSWDIQSCKHLTLTYILNEDVDVNALKNAWVQVSREFPYFLRTMVMYVDGNLYYTDRNAEAVVYREDDMREADGDYFGRALVRVGYSENRITLHIFHALLDGFGMGVLGRNLLTTYFTGLGHNIEPLPFDKEMKDHINEMEIDPFFDRKAVSAGYNYKFLGDAKGFLLPERGESYSTRYYFGLELSTGKYRRLCMRVLGDGGKKLFRTNATMIGGMTVIATSILLARAIQDENPGNEEDITVRCPVNVRNETGTPYSLMNGSLIQAGFAFSPDSLKEEMDLSVLSELSGSIERQMAPDYIKSCTNVLHDYLEDFMSNYMKTIIPEVSDTNKTFLATNLGMIGVEPMPQTIVSIEAENVANIPMMIQLSSIEDRQYILITQNFPTDKYFRRFKELITGYGVAMEDIKCFEQVKES